jgi:hypothetical protein
MRERKTPARSTAGSTGLSPAGAASCSSLQPRFLVVAGYFSWSLFPADVPARLLIPRSLVRIHPGPFSPLSLSRNRMVMRLRCVRCTRLRVRCLRGCLPRLASVRGRLGVERSGRVPRPERRPRTPARRTEGRTRAARRGRRCMPARRSPVRSRYAPSPNRGGLRASWRFGQSTRRVPELARDSAPPRGLTPRAR